MSRYSEFRSTPDQKLVSNSCAAAIAFFSTRLLVDDDGPRRDRREQQQRQDGLHERARVENQPDDRQIVVH